MNRYCAASRRKLEQAVGYFNQHEDLHFVVSLGDTIDRGWDSFDAILPIYGQLNAPPRFVLGNHDFLVGEDRLHEVPGRLGLTRSYYDFAAAGHRFIVVDGSEISLFANRAGSPKHALAAETLAGMVARGEANAQDWNGGMSDSQYAWLEQKLRARPQCRRAGHHLRPLPCASVRRARHVGRRSLHRPRHPLSEASSPISTATTTSAITACSAASTSSISAA